MSLSGVASQIGNTITAKNFAGDYCSYIDGFDMNTGNPNSYIESQTCEEPTFQTLNNGEWAVTFDYGTVIGEALCSPTYAEYAEQGNPVVDSGNNQGTGSVYCWCRVKGFVEVGNSTYQNVTSNPWGVGYIYGGENYSQNYDYCHNNHGGSCEGYCAINFWYDAQLRRALFGITQ